MRRSSVGVPVGLVVLALTAAVTMTVVGVRSAWGAGDTLTVQFVDVRQGDAILVAGPCGQLGVIDTPRFRKANMAAAIDRLGSLAEVAWVSVSHYDADHLGDDSGLTGIIKDVHAVNPALVVYDRGGPRTAKDSATYRGYYDYVTGAGIRAPVGVDTSWTLCGGDRQVTVSVVAVNGVDDSGDLDGTATEENDLGVCLKVEYRDFDMATCGDVNGTDDGSRTDIEAGVADELASIDLVKVGHHGSGFSSSQAFVDAVDAQAAVVSVGANGFGHPSATVVDRWQAAGADLWQTNYGQFDDGTGSTGNDDLHGTVTATTTGRGTFTVTPTAPGHDLASYPLDDTTGGDGGGFATVRLAGPDRIATAAQIAETVWPDGAPVVLVASAATFADALAGASLSGIHDAPVLLTGPDRLAADTAQTIEALGASRAVVLGGPAAVSPAVVDDLAAQLDRVDRIAGPDRYATAAAIADQAAGQPGVDTTTVYLASGENFPDAVAISAAAAAGRRPLLLTRPDQLPAATADTLAGLTPATIVVVGGPAAIADHTVAQAATAAGDAATVRIHGSDRYATAAGVATHATEVGLDATARLWAATGAGYPDAIAAGPAAAHQNSTLLLVAGDTLTRATVDYLQDLNCTAGGLTIAGGTTAITDTTRTQLHDLLNC